MSNSKTQIKTAFSTPAGKDERISGTRRITVKYGSEGKGKLLLWRAICKYVLKLKCTQFLIQQFYSVAFIPKEHTQSCPEREM